MVGTPLAERMRPVTFDEFVGQQDILAPGKTLREAIEHDRLRSIILWGPPGTGKTTLARLIAKATRARFVSFSAVLAGIKEIKEVMAAAELARRQMNRRTIVFVDEIHRFNKSQQDAFLPRVEAGDIVLVGATTELRPKSSRFWSARLVTTIAVSATSPSTSRRGYCRRLPATRTATRGRLSTCSS
jgi:putative ATPase